MFASFRVGGSGGIVAEVGLDRFRREGTKAASCCRHASFTGQPLVRIAGVIIIFL
jgi:hypothetical protein